MDSQDKPVVGEVKDSYTRQASVLRVVDGDTLDLEADLGFSVFHRLRVRLLGVNTPEIYGVSESSEEFRRGKVASEFTASRLPEKSQVLVQTFKVPSGEKKEKYGRFLAKVWYRRGDAWICVNDDLASMGWGSK